MSDRSGRMGPNGQKEHEPVSNELRALLARVEDSDPDTAKELRRHFDALQSRRQFGLNFERHTPESVALTGRPISVGDKVRFLPPRGETEVESKATWIVTAISDSRGKRVASLLDPRTKKEATRALEDLIFVADFRDPIYPGLVSTGKVERGGDKPYHAVINAENYHALEAMLFTYQGRVDCIYIDPPYNTRANDWKYNNDYVDPGDSYSHSKWLAFMERRLKVAKKLLNPRDSVLIVTIDEKEYLRLGLLLEQTFPEANVQMVTSCIKPSGSQRASEFSRVDEYLFFVMIGEAAPASDVTDMLRDGAEPKSSNKAVTWHGLRRRGSTDWRRSHRPNGFYPVYIVKGTADVHAVGEPIPLDKPRSEVEAPVGCFAAWPLDPNGEESRWQISPKRLREQLAEGTAVVSSVDEAAGTAGITYLKGGDLAKVRNGEVQVVGRADDGRVIIQSEGLALRRPKTMWLMESHDASAFGTALLSKFLPGRSFPFPKSLYAVEDALRFFLRDKQEALVVDFFAGSGTTAHAVMRLNKQTGGRRRSVSVTNNEVNDQEKRLLKNGLRPGDTEWEQEGICERVTKPRIEAAVSGVTPDGTPVAGDYKFRDPFPMSDGFEENVEFFTLTYENAALVELDLAFERIAPLLWMRAGSEGRRIDARTDTFDVADTYAVLFNVDASRSFLAAVDKAEGLRIAYIVTDDETQYQAVAGQLPDGVESVRLYESYLRTFQINTGRA